MLLIRDFGLLEECLSDCKT